MLEFKVKKADAKVYRCIAVTTPVKMYDGSMGQTTVAQLENSVGHCCGMSMLGNLSTVRVRDEFFWNKKENVDDFIAFLKAAWEDGAHYRDEHGSSLTLFTIAGFHVVLSAETRTYDTALRNHPNIKLVQKFRNRKAVGIGGDEGNELSLYFMEF